LFDEVGQVAAVVDMRMGEDHSVNIGGFKIKVKIVLVGIIAFALEEDDPA